jgi:hypothetical protein
VTTDFSLPPSQWRVAYSTNASGSWVTESADIGDIATESVALDLDNLGRPHILYSNWNNDGLLRARRINGSWTIDTPYTGAAIRHPSIDIDGSGVPHIAFSAKFGVEPGVRIVYLTGAPGAWSATTLSTGQFNDYNSSIARGSDGLVWVVNWRWDAGVRAYRRALNGSWSSAAVSSSPYDGQPTLTIDAAGTPHVAYLRGVYYGGSGCTEPECPSGAGVRHAEYNGSAWDVERVTPMWQDNEPAIAAGADGSLGIVFNRLGTGLRSLTLVPGSPNVALRLQGGSDSGTSTTDGITNAGSLTFDVTFNRSVTGVAAGDFGRTGTATGCVVGAPSGSGAAYTVVVTGCSAGTVGLSFAANGASDGESTGPSSNRSAPTVTIDRTAPTVTAPALSLRSGVSLSSASTTVGLPVSLAWSAIDAGGAGIASYDVARSDNGAAFATIASATSATSLNATVTPGHTYRYEARARDKAGNLATYVIGPSLKPSLYQGGNSAIKYTGTWSTGTSTSYSNGTVKFAKAAGASASYTFTGRAIAFVTTKRSTAGKVKVYLDGVLVSTIDTVGSSTTYRYIAFQKTWTTSGTHTLKLVVSGTSGRPRVDLDALEVIR